MDVNTAYLSIGSNLGEKKKNLDTAIDALKKNERITVEKVSPFYRTQPQNFTDQDWFVNGALKILTPMSPGELLIQLKALEKTMDKDGKPFRFGPRVIDLDIILYNDQIVKTDNLEIPHPRMHERCFVLVPLCDIALETVHPVLHQTPAELLNKIEEQETQAVIPLDEEA